MKSRQARICSLKMLAVWKHAQEAAQGCENFVAQYNEYAYLWTSDPQASFNQFMASGSDKRPQSPSRDVKEQSFLACSHRIWGSAHFFFLQKALHVFPQSRKLSKSTPASLSLGFIRIDARPTEKCNCLISSAMESSSFTLILNS